MTKSKDCRLNLDGVFHTKLYVSILITMKLWLIILLHQIIFQGMFFTKNISLTKKTGKVVRGKNKEANISICLFITFIILAFGISFFQLSFGKVIILSDHLTLYLGLTLLLLNILVSGASLLHLKDSWRVGVLEDQKTTLISNGIYKFTRNPYFVSYLLMFAAYTILLQNLILLGLSVILFFAIHKMIIKEEEYLYSKHGDSYTHYKAKVPRYIIL